jgi:DNA-binding NarL/FixJ family response regulator
MSLSISIVLTTAPVTAANSGAAAAAPAPQKVQQPAQSAGPDTVTLTAAQQVFQLYNQGQSVTQIATSLSLSVSSVNNYLGINASAG